MTSKLNNNRLERDDILRSFDQSLADLGFDQLDLFLVHWPLPGVSDYVARWKAMEEIYAERPGAGDRCLQLPAAPPEHPVRGDRGPAGGQPDRGAPVPDAGRRARLRRRARDRHRGLGADRPGQGRSTTPSSPRSPSRLGQTPAQVTLRWHVQRGDVVFPKSVTRSRVEENFDIFDFELDESAMAAHLRR